jgi:3-deoxy-manno-octulosonate cytidylyltransferase (CMP-KDO synthetase)
MAETLIVIPARYASTRFPGKPLAKILGKPMIQRVLEQCSQVKNCDVCVATDDDSIYNFVHQLGYQVYKTSANHISGTDRVAEVASKNADYDFIINVQGDEPCIDPKQIKQIIYQLKNGAKIATLIKKINQESALSPNIVKATISASNRALYFSRSIIPFPRYEVASFYKHIGLYGFERATLLELSKLDSSPLEKSESLEQLRWLENDYAIQCSETEIETPSVDTPDDINSVEEYIQRKKLP